ncbi:MAG TPA: hypothetical protein VIE43_08595 [Thermoanaerobaculia bacterium]|jgi:hypothetical protein|nr:hypothetical protein [Thermoanaerobaculia bacterium]
MREPVEPAGIWEDPIVAEVRAVRERLFADAGYSLEKFGQMLRESQASSDHEVINLSPRRPERDAA